MSFNLHDPRVRDCFAFPATRPPEPVHDVIRLRIEQVQLMHRAEAALYLGDVALGRAQRLDLIEVGQRVQIKPEKAQTLEQRSVVFEVADVVGEGADAFASLLGPDGTLSE